MGNARSKKKRKKKEEETKKTKQNNKNPGLKLYKAAMIHKDREAEKEKQKKWKTEQEQVLQQQMEAMQLTECAACHIKPAINANRPCGHILFCDECLKDFRKRNGNICPTCKKQSEIDTDTLKKTSLTCDICYEDWESNCIVKVSDDCDHLVCVSCMVEHVRTALKDRTMFDEYGIGCPYGGNCYAKVKNKIYQLKNVSKKTLPDKKKRSNIMPLTIEECDKYGRFMSDAKIPKWRRIYCTNELCFNPNCDMLRCKKCHGRDGNERFVQDIGEENVGKMNKFICIYCEDKKSALCTKCKNAWHPKYIDCDQAYAAKRDGHDKSNLVIELTTKKCPACDERISHYHGHGCHHISPERGCPFCGTHWCYSCPEGTQPMRIKKRNSYCSKMPQQCRLFCNESDIKKYIDKSSGWPVDVRCGCPLCPDCRRRKPCANCDGGCVVCQGICPPGELVGKAKLFVERETIQASAPVLPSAPQLVYHFDNGDQYEGEMEPYGTPHGNGIMKYANGITLEGGWLHGKKYGFSILRTPAGDMFNGEYKNNQRNGKGTMQYISGDSYIGEWKDNKKDGNGKYTFVGGSVYDGEWKNGNCHGKGTYRYASGNVYTGEWVVDKKQGQGKYIWTDGKVYKGEWRNDQRFGNGWMEYRNGDRHNGEWKYDKRDGKGIFTRRNGTKITGFWKDDNVVNIETIHRPLHYYERE